ncbi:MAG: FAD-dependent monooxygenase [Sulfobacillus sp.]
MERIPVAIVGGGPIGLAAGLEFERFGIPYKIFEEDPTLSSKPKAGTILPRSLEILKQEGVIQGVLREGLRFDEVHFIDRVSDRVLMRMLMHPMSDESLYPFILNLPQSDLEAIMAEKITQSKIGELNFNHRLQSVEQTGDTCVLKFETAQGHQSIEAQYVLACDGGRSVIRHQLGIEMEGVTHPERFLVADFKVDLDRRAGRQLTYLSYVFDPDEWVIFVRQPWFWRFLIPILPDADEPVASVVIDKIRRVVKNPSLPIELIDMGIYNVHHRTATKWQDGRIFLLGDAAHLITPVGGLGLNTGIQDANNLVWKLAWVLQGWAGPELLHTYEQERAPIARFNARNQADRNRDVMRMKSPIKRTVRNIVLGWMDKAEGLQWQAAHVRSLLGTTYKPKPQKQSVFMQWKTARHFVRPPVEVGDRIPDGEVLDPQGVTARLHDFFDDGFLALYVQDVRTRPDLGQRIEGVHKWLLTRFDAAFDTHLRSHALYDKGGRLAKRIAAQPGSIYLIRPDGHVAAIIAEKDATKLPAIYRQQLLNNAGCPEPDSVHPMTATL